MIANRPSEAPDACALCKRQVKQLTQHHLVPRCRVRKQKRRSRRKVASSAADPSPPSYDDVTVPLCRPCHSMIHAVLTEKELASTYNTIEALLEHPKISEFVQWVARQRDGRISVRWTNDRRESKRRSRR